MKKLNNVEKKFLQRGLVQPTGWFILSRKDSLEFLGACKEENIKILGIDGFFLLSDGIQPSMDNSVDFSSDYILKTDDIYTDAIEFLKNKDEKLFFEIVCSDK